MPRPGRRSTIAPIPTAPDEGEKLIVVAVALTPVADAAIVLTHGGRLSTALGVHGPTAVLLVAAGLVLALG